MVPNEPMGDRDDRDHHHHADNVEDDEARRRALERRVRAAWDAEPEATTMAEQLVSPTLRARESNCSFGCGKDGGACGSGGACGTGGCGVGSIVDLIEIDVPYTDERRIVEVRYKGARREFVDVVDADVRVRVNDLILITSDRGVDAAFVSMTGSLVHAKRKAKRLGGEPITTMLRPADPEDAELYNRNRSSEMDAMSVCRSRVDAFKLPMKLVDAEWQFDHHRITFYFTADGRIDFRELVRDLAGIFRTRIELRQISVRDEARRIGGMGVCGRELCCTTHLGRYEHITLDHAKLQMLQVNPTKLSGQCGRLKCCLLYELDNYVNGLARFPAIDSIVATTVGMGRVMKIDIFRDLLYLHHSDNDQWETLTLEELKAITAGNRDPLVVEDGLPDSDGEER